MEKYFITNVFISFIRIALNVATLGKNALIKAVKSPSIPSPSTINKKSKKKYFLNYKRMVLYIYHIVNDCI